MLGVRIPPGLPFPPDRPHRTKVLDKIKQILNVVQQFLKESRAELKKVTWPTPKQAITSTSVVIVVTVIVSLVLGLVDFGLAKIIRLVLG